MPDPKTSTPTRARRMAAGIPSSSELADRVRDARKAAGLSQSQAASKLGIGARTYAMRESTTTLPYAMALEMVRVLGYDRAILCPEILDETAAHGDAPASIRRSTSP